MICPKSVRIFYQIGAGSQICRITSRWQSCPEAVEELELVDTGFYLVWTGETPRKLSSPIRVRL